MVGERLGRGMRAVALGEWFVGVAIIAVGWDFLGSCWSLCIGFWLFFGRHLFVWHFARYPIRIL